MPIGSSRPFRPTGSKNASSRKKKHPPGFKGRHRPQTGPAHRQTYHRRRQGPSYQFQFSPARHQGPFNGRSGRASAGNSVRRERQIVEKKSQKKMDAKGIISTASIFFCDFGDSCSCPYCGALSVISEKVAPVGSLTTQKRPTLGMSVGGTQTLPPNSQTFAAEASTSSTAI